MTIAYAQEGDFIGFTLTMWDVKFTWLFVALGVLFVLP